MLEAMLPSMKLSPHFTNSSISDPRQPPSPPSTLPGIKVEPSHDRAVRSLRQRRSKVVSLRAPPSPLATGSPPLTEIVSSSAFYNTLSPCQTVIEREMHRDMTRQTALYDQDFNPAREQRQSPGSEGPASYVFPPGPPLSALLRGSENVNHHAACLGDSGRRQKSLDYGNSRGNTNPCYRSPTPPLQRAQSEELRRQGVSEHTGCYDERFKRSTFFEVTDHRLASGGNLAHLPQSAPRFNTYERRHESRIPGRPPLRKQPVALNSPRGSPSATEIAQPKSKRHRADPEQLAVLVDVFERTPFPSTEERHALAFRLGMTSRSVQIWFQNRRQTTKAAQMSAAQVAAIAANEELGASISSKHRRLSIQQLEALNNQFSSKSEIPDEITNQTLARDLGLQSAFVRAWFDQRRSEAKVKRNDRNFQSTNTVELVNAERRG